MRTTNDPKSAPIGTAFLSVCETCGADLPDILIKTRGLSSDRVQYTGPMKMASGVCEFCQFVGAYKAQEKYEGRCAAGKIVDEAGKLIAYIAFQDDDDKKTITLKDGTVVPRAHGLVIEAHAVEGGDELMKVLEPGISCDNLKEDNTEEGL